MPIANFQFKPVFQAKTFTPQDYINVNNATKSVMNAQQTQDLQSFLRNNYLKSISDYINNGKQFTDTKRIYRLDETPFVQRDFINRVRKNPFFTNQLAFDAMNANQLGTKMARMNKKKTKTKTKKIEKRKYFD
jgi:hypothetical protein